MNIFKIKEDIHVSSFKTKPYSQNIDSMFDDSGFNYIRIF